MERPVLVARDLRRTHAGAGEAVAALNGVSLELGAGEMVAVMGPSGCGKSTLLQICGLMDAPDAGELEVEGRPMGSAGEAELTRLRRERVGFVFQFFNLLPTLTVGENIALPLLLAGAPLAEARSRAAEMAARVGLGGRLGHLPAQVSGGEAQRAALARAVIHRPALLIADEPTGSLDSANGAAVLKLLRELNRETGVAILLATHDAAVAAGADRLLRMRDGRLESGAE
jgi:putative ABC transport system ATP-binding protein